MSTQIKHLNTSSSMKLWKRKRKEFQNTDQETITKYRFNDYF